MATFGNWWQLFAAVTVAVAVFFLLFLLLLSERSSVVSPVIFSNSRKDLSNSTNIRRYIHYTTNAFLPLDNWKMVDGFIPLLHFKHHHHKTRLCHLLLQEEYQLPLAATSLLLVSQMSLVMKHSLVVA